MVWSRLGAGATKLLLARFADSRDIKAATRGNDWLRPGGFLGKRPFGHPSLLG